MPIHKMQRIRITAHSDHKEGVIEKLHDLSIIEIEHTGELPEGGFTEEPDMSDIERRIAELVYAIDFLYTYSEKPSLLGSFFSPRYAVEREYYESLVGNYDFSIINTIREKDQELSELKNEETRLKSLIEQLLPWEQLSLSLEDFETKKTVTEIGILPKEALGEFSSLDYAHIEIPQLTERKVWAAVTYLKSYAEEMEEQLRKIDFQKISLPAGLKGLPKEILKTTASQIEDIEERREELEKECTELAQERFNLMILHDYYSDLKSKHTVRRDFVNTEKAFILEGWIKKKDIALLEEELSSMPEIDITAYAPDDSDNIPVMIENRGVFRRFELVTKIYGLPAYQEVDPTLLLTPFFIVFFALCLSDFIYGIVLIGLSFYLPKKIKMGPDGKMLFRVLIVGGLLAIVFGLLTGGWAGDLPASFSFLSSVENIRASVMVVDLLKNPLVMLEIALLLGLVQVWSGILIRGYMNVRDGYILDALFDQGLWLVLLPVGTLVLINRIFGANIPYPDVMFKIALGCLVGLVLTQGRYQKASNLPLTIFKKGLVGVLSIYNIFGYLGDVLSYSRILALGLATAALASAFNMVAIQLGGGLRIVGPILVVGLLLVLHTINFVISGLGAFVHSGRLQYVEYFTKFLEGGGRTFKPFGTYSKYIKVQEELHV
jgi:V/A-type H+-transporting ATPase subunit I